MGLGQHWPVLMIVLLLALLFFGTKRLPEMGSAIGKTIKEFQKSMREVTSDDETPKPPAVPPATTQQAELSAPRDATTTTAEAPRAPETTIP